MIYSMKRLFKTFLHLFLGEIQSNTASSTFTKAQITKDTHRSVQCYNYCHGYVENTWTSDEMIWMRHAVLDRKYLENIEISSFIYTI